jgi:hypothetical protein
VTDPGARRPSRWSLLGLVVAELDVRIGWRRHRRTMSHAELDACRAMLARVPAAVEAWSDGNARLGPVDVVTADAPVRGLARVGGGWWLNPESARPLLDPILARTASIDSVIALYPSDGDRGLTGAWGYTWGRVGWLGGAGFSSIVSDPWTGWAGMEDAEHGFVHEWLHQVEAVYRGLGFSLDELPALHDVADRCTTRTDVPDRDETYVEHERQTRSWRPWYRDYMTGTVGPKTGEAPAVRGLTPERWARRTSP